MKKLNNNICNFTKFIKLCACLITFFSLSACPGGNACDDDSPLHVTDEPLASIQPLQDVYTIGDIVTFKISIPNTTTFPNVNLLAASHDNSPLAVLTSQQLFIGNELNFIKGSQGGTANSFYMEYVQDTNSFELEVKITLQNAGVYSFYAIQHGITFGSDCNQYGIRTDTAGAVDGFIDFIVE